MSKRRNLAAVAILCGALGVGGWTFYVNALARGLGEGWMVFYNPIRLYFDGQLGLLYDGVQSTALLNARFAHWLAHPLPLHP